MTKEFSESIVLTKELFLHIENHKNFEELQCNNKELLKITKITKRLGENEV